MTAQTTPTHSSSNGSHPVVYPNRRRTLVLFIVGAVLLLLVVFFTARCEGIKQGRHDAREKIEKENDITAGPDNLIS